MYLQVYTVRIHTARRVTLPPYAPHIVSMHCSIRVIETRNPLSVSPQLSDPLLHVQFGTTLNTSLKEFRDLAAQTVLGEQC